MSSKSKDKKVNSKGNVSLTKKEFDEFKSKLMNGALSDAILGYNPGGIGTQLNQVDTLFKNNRYYLVSNMRQLISQIYVEHGIIQTVVDVPVDDGLRGGVEVKTKQLEEDELTKLQSKMEEEDDIGVVAESAKWNRLFGGSGIMVITDQDPEKPLNIEAIKEDQPLKFRAVDMWELFWSWQNTEDYSAAIDGNVLSNVELYNYYSQLVHHTRVFTLKGITAPSFIRPQLRGWGLSILEAIVASVNQYLKENNLVFEVLDEFKVDVFKIKNLANTLVNKDGVTKIQQRVQLANQQKNFQHAITMDSEDDFLTKELAFTGLAEVMQGIRMQIASDLRMPLTKVFGISAAGFSSGEDDIENYNAMVESQVRQKVKFHILRLVKIRCQQLFGHIPDDISINFKPMRILSAEQEENVKTQKHSRLLSTVQSGMMTVEEFKEACNKENLLGVQIDTSIDKIEMESDNEDSAPGKKAPESKLQAKQAKNELEESNGTGNSERT